MSKKDVILERAKYLCNYLIEPNERDSVWDLLLPQARKFYIGKATSDVVWFEKYIAKWGKWFND